jgi:hypothetical protein
MIDIKHYIAKMKEHDEKRLSFNEREAYWKKYLQDHKQDK